MGTLTILLTEIELLMTKQRARKTAQFLQNKPEVITAFVLFADELLTRNEALVLKETEDLSKQTLDLVYFHLGISRGEF